MYPYKKEKIYKNLSKEQVIFFTYTRFQFQVNKLKKFTRTQVVNLQAVFTIFSRKEKKKTERKKICRKFSSKKLVFKGERCTDKQFKFVNQ